MSSILTPYHMNTYSEDGPSLSETEMSLTKTTIRCTRSLMIMVKIWPNRREKYRYKRSKIDMRCDMWTKEWLKYPIKWLKMAKMPENKTEIEQNTSEKQI